MVPPLRRPKSVMKRQQKDFPLAEVQLRMLYEEAWENRGFPVGWCDIVKEGDIVECNAGRVYRGRTIRFLWPF